MSTKAGKRIPNSSSVVPEKCVFCKIVSGESPSHVVYEDQDYIAFLDRFPISKGHTLVCPKKHGETIWDMDEVGIGGLFRTAAKVSKGIVAAAEADGFRLVQNNGEAANQVVAHVHVHVIPVRMEDKGRFMDRKTLSDEEMGTVSRTIREYISRDH
jgi:histidine triad (HIT) family protein